MRREAKECFEGHVAKLLDLRERVQTGREGHGRSLALWREENENGKMMDNGEERKSKLNLFETRNNKKRDQRLDFSFFFFSLTHRRDCILRIIYEGVAVGREAEEATLRAMIFIKRWMRWRRRRRREDDVGKVIEKENCRPFSIPEGSAPPPLLLSLLGSGRQHGISSTSHWLDLTQILSNFGHSQV